MSGKTNDASTDTFLANQLKFLCKNECDFDATADKHLDSPDEMGVGGKRVTGSSKEKLCRGHQRSSEKSSDSFMQVSAAGPACSDFPSYYGNGREIFTGKSVLSIPDGINFVSSIVSSSKCGIDGSQFSKSRHKNQLVSKSSFKKSLPQIHKQLSTNGNYPKSSSSRSNSPRWTQKDLTAALQLVRSGTPIKPAAEKCNMPVMTLWRRTRALGLVSSKVQCGFRYPTRGNIKTPHATGKTSVSSPPSPASKTYSSAWSSGLKTTQSASFNRFATESDPKEDTSTNQITPQNIIESNNKTHSSGKIESSKGAENSLKLSEKFSSNLVTSSMFAAKPQEEMTTINANRSGSSRSPNSTNNIPVFNSQIQFLQQLQSHDTLTNSANRNPFMKFIDYSNPVLVANESQQPINLTTSCDTGKGKAKKDSRVTNIADNCVSLNDAKDDTSNFDNNDIIAPNSEEQMLQACGTSLRAPEASGEHDIPSFEVHVNERNIQSRFGDNAYIKSKRTLVGVGQQRNSYKSRINCNESISSNSENEEIFETSSTFPMKKETFLAVKSQENVQNDVDVSEEQIRFNSSLLANDPPSQNSPAHTRHDTAPLEIKDLKQT